MLNLGIFNVLKHALHIGKTVELALAAARRAFGGVGDDELLAHVAPAEQALTAGHAVNDLHGDEQLHTTNPPQVGPSEGLTVEGEVEFWRPNESSTFRTLRLNLPGPATAEMVELLMESEIERWGHDSPGLGAMEHQVNWWALYAGGGEA